MDIQIEITDMGAVRMLHDDAVDLSDLGTIRVERASHVEFDNATGFWTVRSAKTGELLQARTTRAAALAWEKEYYSPSGKGWRELTQEA